MGKTFRDQKDTRVKRLEEYGKSPRVFNGKYKRERFDERRYVSNEIRCINYDADDDTEE